MPRFQKPAQDAYAEVAAEKVEALAALRAGLRLGTGDGRARD